MVEISEVMWSEQQTYDKYAVNRERRKGTLTTLLSSNHWYYK